MRLRAPASCLAVALLATLPVAVASGPATAAGPLAPVVDWQLDEPAGSTVVVDSSGNGFDVSREPFDPATPRIEAGVATDTGTGYRWHPPLRDPASGKVLADDARVIAAPDDPRLDPGSEDFAVEIRFRTGALQPNLVQKGQSGMYGGYWKVDVVDGFPSCLFRGMTSPRRVLADGTVVPPTYANQNVGWSANRTPPDTRLTSNVWHTIRCALVQHTADAGQDAVLTVDGVSRTSRRNTDIGPVDNISPMSVGGKLSCDPATSTVGCDYYNGLVDYVRVWRSAPNVAPTAAASASCTGLACSFDARATDTDGDALTYSWDFGDGTTATGPTPAKTYSGSGTYPVTVTVSDGRGGTTTSSTEVTVARPVVPIGFRGGVAKAMGSTNVYTTTVPSTVQAGDGLILVSSTAAAVTVNPPTIAGVAGWTPVGQVAGAAGPYTTVWQRVATATDAGKTVRIQLGASSKGDLQLLAYAGTSTAGPVASMAAAAQAGSARAHVTPGAPAAAAGSWVLSYWADKSSATTAWAAPDTGTARLLAVNTAAGAGRVGSLTVDRGPLGGGPVPGLTATADSASANATMLDLVLAPSS